jgi:hypothetical protein
MKTYINIEVLGRKIVLQKDILGSYNLSITKKSKLPKIVKEALERLDRTSSNDQEKVRKLIKPLYSRSPYSKDDIIVTAMDNMIKVASSTSATDISEPMKPVVLTKEERQRIDEVLKKANQVIFDLKGNEHNVTKQMYGI